MWTDREFNARMNRRFRKRKKELGAPENYVVTEGDYSYAMNVLSEFVEMEKGFIDYLRDTKTWVHEGQDENGNWVEHEWSPSKEGGCGCGCGDA